MANVVFPYRDHKSFFFFIKPLETPADAFLLHLSVYTVRKDNHDRWNSSFSSMTQV